MSRGCIPDRSSWLGTILYPAASAMAFDQAPSGARGWTLSVYNIVVLAGGIVGAIGFGWLAERLGYRPAFFLAALPLVVGVLAFWQKRRSRAG